jgi:predicted kinase
LTQGDTPWNPSSFSDQVADKFHQQVMDNEQKNSLNNKYDYSSDIKVNSLKHYCLTQGDTPWNPSSFSYQVADKFHQQVMDNEQKNSLNNKYDYSSDIKVDLVEK